MRVMHVAQHGLVLLCGPQGCQEGPLIRSFQDPGNNRVNMKASEGRFSMENRMDKPSGPLKGQAWEGYLGSWVTLLASPAGKTGKGRGRR